jgi:hypothetical protein
MARHSAEFPEDLLAMVFDLLHSDKSLKGLSVGFEPFNPSLRQAPTILDRGSACFRWLTPALARSPFDQSPVLLLSGVGQGYSYNVLVRVLRVFGPGKGIREKLVAFQGDVFGMESLGRAPKDA